jgi:hypothetical protein
MPILRLDVCSESEAIFTCVVMESKLIMSWDIDFQDVADDNINRVLFIRGEGPTELTFIHNRGLQVGVEYRFMVTSLSPFTSTMTTNTSTDLSGAIVSCSDGPSRHPQSIMGMNTLALPGNNTKLSQ